MGKTDGLVKFSLFGQGPKVDGTNKKTKKNIHDDMLSCCATKKNIKKYNSAKEVNVSDSSNLSTRL